VVDHDALDSILNDARMPKLLQEYFDPEGSFAGTTFDSLGTNPPFEISSDDLLAVTLLDVRFPPRSVRNLLGGALNDLLRDMDPAARLEESPGRSLEAAAEAWHLLVDRDRDFPGIGKAIASKLLSRKRPTLVPIADSVILGALKPTKNHFWDELGEVLSGVRMESLRQLRPPSALGVSELRILDVAVWMTHSQSKAAKRAQKLAAAEP